MSVAIVGGGVTGLSMAYLLRQREIPVTLFEAASREGGLGGSWRRDGFSFDFGPHEFCTDNPELLRLLPEICGDDLVRVQKRTAQYFCGRFVRYPFQLGDLLRNVPLSLCVRAVLEAAWARGKNLVRAPNDDSFETWTRARFGNTLFELYFGPYTRKVWGVEPHELDASTAAERVSVDSIWDLARKVAGLQWLGREDYEHTHSEFRHGFLYVRGGMGTLQAHLRRHAEQRGTRIEFGKRLTTVRRERPGAVALEFADGTRADGFSHVVSTIPLNALVDATLGDEGRRLNAKHRLPFRGMVFVFLRVDRPQLSENHWTYFPDAEVPFQRTTEFSHFVADMCPAGQAGIALEVAADPGEPAWDGPDEDVVASCVAGLQRLGLLDPADVLGADVVRVRHAYPVQVRGYPARVDALLDGLDTVPELVTVGRQGLFRYCNMNECMEMALDVAPRVAAGEHSIRYTRESTWRGVSVEDAASAPPPPRAAAAP